MEAHNLVSGLVDKDFEECIWTAVRNDSPLQWLGLRDNLHEAVLAKLVYRLLLVETHHAIFERSEDRCGNTFVIQRNILACKNALNNFLSSYFCHGSQLRPIL